MAFSLSRNDLMFASQLLELIKLSGCVRREGSYLLIAEAVVAGVASLDGISKRPASEIKACCDVKKCGSYRCGFIRLFIIGWEH